MDILQAASGVCALSKIRQYAFWCGLVLESPKPLTPTTMQGRIRQREGGIGREAFKGC